MLLRWASYQSPPELWKGLGRRPAMSALPSKADMCGALAHVCFGAEADIGADQCCLSGVFDAQINLAAKRPEIDRLGEKCVSTVLQGLALGVRIAIGGNHDHRDIRSKGFGLR